MNKKTPVRFSARHLTCLCFNASKKVEDLVFLEVAFKNNIPNMLSALAYHYFRNNGVVPGSKDDWETVRRGINNLETTGVYEDE